MKSPVKNPKTLQSLLRHMDAFAATRRGAAVAWWGFAVMAAAGLWFAATYCLTMPYGDEWEWLPVAAGQQPVTLSWLWSLHNEHRLPLPRLIYVALGAVTHFDFRAGAFFNVLVLSVLALLMMWGARRLRGRSSAYDIFFPLVLLHWSHCDNVPFAFQVQFIASVFLTGVVLLTIVRCGPQLGIRSAAFITICLLGLGMCGLNGLVYLPPMACWLAFAGVSRWREAAAHSRRDSLVVCQFGNCGLGATAGLSSSAENTGGQAIRGTHKIMLNRPLVTFALAAVVLAFVAVYFIGFHRNINYTTNFRTWATTTLQFLSISLGPASRSTWPALAIVVPVALGLSVWQLYRVFRDESSERVRAAGLTLFLCGFIGMAAAVGLGRAGMNDRPGLEMRYVTLGAPMLCLFYLQCVLYGSPAVKTGDCPDFRPTKMGLSPWVVQWFSCRTLALLMCALLVINTQKGLSYANNLRRTTTRLADAIRTGLPPDALAIRYVDDLGFAPTEVFARRLEMLQYARLGPYRETVDGGETHASARRLSDSIHATPTP